MFEFLEIADVLDLYNESLKRYGGVTGLREPGVLDSALASALNTLLYTQGVVSANFWLARSAVNPACPAPLGI